MTLRLKPSVAVLAQTFGSLLLAVPAIALANADVEKNIAKPGNWAVQAGDMFNQRYSQLKQINTGNVKNMQVAWTFSTGVLRGHEG
jgi:glucose dehydrogenase